LNRYLSGQVLQNGSAVDGSGGTDTAVVGGLLLQETVDTTNRELKGRIDFSNDVVFFERCTWIPARAEREVGEFFFLSSFPLSLAPVLPPALPPACRIF